MTFFQKLYFKIAIGKSQWIGRIHKIYLIVKISRAEQRLRFSTDGMEFDWNEIVEIELKNRKKITTQAGFRVIWKMVQSEI